MIAFAIIHWKKSVAVLRVCTLLAFAGLASCLISLLVHFLKGHGKNSSEAMSIAEFLPQHPSFLVVGIASIVLVCLSLYSRK